MTVKLAAMAGAAAAGGNTAAASSSSSDVNDSDLDSDAEGEHEELRAVVDRMMKEESDEDDDGGGEAPRYEFLRSSKRVKKFFFKCTATACSRVLSLPNFTHTLTVGLRHLDCPLRSTSTSPSRRKTKLASVARSPRKSTICSSSK